MESFIDNLISRVMNGYQKYADGIQFTVYNGEKQTNPHI